MQIIINYITCTNILLKKMGIVESDLCTFCNLTKEDIEHLFFSCPCSLIFWKDFELCWKTCTNSNFNLTSQDVILGISGNKNGFLNYCITLGKSIIYYCRRNNVKPTRCKSPEILCRGKEKGWRDLREKEPSWIPPRHRKIPESAKLIQKSKDVNRS